MGREGVIAVIHSAAIVAGQWTIVGGILFTWLVFFPGLAVLGLAHVLF